MKKSVRKTTHTGNQPISVLKHNITTRLVERNEKYIEQLQSDFKLNKHISYNIADLPLVQRQCPYITEDGTINIHETYLSYIWITSYYFFVMHEELLVIPEAKKRGLPVRKEQNLSLYENAKELFDYGSSLIKTFFKWDLEYYPNPEYFDENTEEGWYIMRTNDLFVETLNFILFHEMAHAELCHIKKINEQELSELEQKQLELEADTRAIELMKANIVTPNKGVCDIGIIAGLASILFFKENLNGGNKHPDIDVRLNNAINQLKLDDLNPTWSLLCLFLKEWINKFNLSISEKGSYENYKELFEKLLFDIKNRD